MASLSMLVIFIGIYKTGASLYEGVQTLTPNGVGDPKLMSAHISQSLVNYVVYCFMALPGWLFAMAVLLFTNYRSKPYYYFLTFISVVLVLGFPFSTLFGIALGVALFLKRKQFQKNQ
ncbi:hypothetical protein [Pseudoalteromonas piratica]|nr:hypothetical protein [Pseudoalteromonas piratica]